MVVTDMDGTLLNSNHEVSSQFYILFEELKKRGIIFVAASGRQYNSIIEKLHPIKDDIIVIAENGGFAKKQDQELFATPINKKIAYDILHLLGNVNDIHPVLCSKNKAYINGDSPEFILMIKEFYSEFNVVANQLNVEDEILKIAIYHFESSEEFIYPKVKHLEDNLKVKISGPNWVDISHQNANKGYALQKVMDDYGITSDEVMVFGDYNNDIEMLQLATHSFAMANAHPNVLKTAKYRTLSNDENGVEHILEQVLGIKK